MSDQIVNPKTNRKVKVGSAVYKKLVKEGVIEPVGEQANQYVKKEPQESEPQPSSEESGSDELVPEQPVEKPKKPRKKAQPKKKAPKE
jgi:hypothetical protein